MRCPCGYSWLVRLVGHVDEVGIAPWMTGLVLYLRYCVSPNFDASDCSGCYLSALSLLSICPWLFILHVPGLVGNFRSCVWSTSRYLAASLSLSSHFLTICPTCSDRCRLHCWCNVLNVVVPESACDFLGIFALLLLSHCLSHVYASLSRSLVVVVIQSFTICAFIFSSASLVQLALAWPRSCLFQLQHHELGISLIFSPYAESCVGWWLVK